MKHLRSLLYVSCILLAMILICTSCGAVGSSDTAYDIAPEGYNSYTSEDVLVEEPADGNSGAQSKVELHNDNTSSVDNNRKIIVRTELDVQTKEFDTLMDAIDSKVAELGGYVEAATVHGTAMNSHSTRYAELVIRIPAETDDDFTAFISDHSVITRRAVDTDDVTLQYVDMESRLSVLRAEKESLEALLKQATAMEDIIVVTEKLTEVISEIESYQSQLRVFDNLIDYSTVTLNIDEVEYTSQVEEQSAWVTIWNNLKKNFANMWDGVVAVFVFLISAIPYLIPFAVIGLIVLLIIRRSVRRRRKTAERAKIAEESKDE